MSNTYFNISDKLRLYEFDGLLDQYGDAAAAYSLRKLRSGYTGSAIRVRRSSDNTERDMGFYDNELDTVALLDWVNEEYIYYQSDFRASNPYTVVSERVDISVGESVAGVDDAIKLTLIDGAGAHSLVPILNNTSITGQEFRLEFDYYIPSTNALVDRLAILNFFDDGNISVNVLDEWTSFSGTATTKALPDNVDLFFRAASATSQFPDADGDVFYLKNIRVTQLTADGFVQTWYDQSGNGNDLTQATASEQSKIVSSGSTILENGKPCIDYNISKYTSSYQMSDDSDLLISMVFRVDVQQDSNPRYLTLVSPTINLQVGHNGTSNYFIRKDSVTTITNSAYTTNGSQNLLSWGASSNSLYFGLNGSNVSFTANGAPTVDSKQPNGITLFKGFDDSSAYAREGTIQELVIYESDEATTQSGIEFNINTYYSIY